MVKISKIVFFILFFLLSLIYFVPKSSLYYYAEHSLEKEHIVINNEKVIENLFQLELQEFELYYNNIQSAEVNTMSLRLLIFSNTIEIEGVKLNSIAKDFIPLSIDNITLHQDIINPLLITINAKGLFGSIHGTFHLLEREVNITLNPSTQMLKSYKRTLSYFKKIEGEYYYAKTF